MEADNWTEFLVPKAQFLCQMRQSLSDIPRFLFRLQTPLRRTLCRRSYWPPCWSWCWWCSFSWCWWGIFSGGCLWAQPQPLCPPTEAGGRQSRAADGAVPALLSCQHEQKELLQDHLVCTKKGLGRGGNAALLLPELPGERGASLPGSGDTGKLWWPPATKRCQMGSWKNKVWRDLLSNSQFDLCSLTHNYSEFAFISNRSDGVVIKEKRVWKNTITDGWSWKGP